MEEGVLQDGSNLSGVSAVCRWQDATDKQEEEVVACGPEVGRVCWQC